MEESGERVGGSSNSTKRVRDEEVVARVFVGEAALFEILNVPPQPAALPNFARDSAQ
jgi:hypothetical protein